MDSNKETKTCFKNSVAIRQQNTASNWGLYFVNITKTCVYLRVGVVARYSMNLKYILTQKNINQKSKYLATIAM